MKTALLSDAERLIVGYLAAEEWNQVGECYGAALDSLVERKLALRVPSTRSHRHPHFDLVRLTGCGWLVVNLEREGS